MRRDEFVAGPKLPHWPCKCGELENYQCRKVCRKCNAAPPKAVSLKQEKAAAEARRPDTRDPKGPRGRWAEGPPPKHRAKELAALKESLEKSFEERLARLGMGSAELPPPRVASPSASPQRFNLALADGAATAKDEDDALLNTI